MRVVFIGTGEIGLPVLRWLIATEQHELVGVVTQPDKPAGRSQELQPPAVKVSLQGSSIPVLQPRRIKSFEAVEEIRTLSPDAIVVMAYGQILPRAVLEISPVACLNLHASLLPRHRGAAPIQAAIAAGDSETGITVMYMDEGLDTGDILLQSSIAISPNETGGLLHDRLGEVAPAALNQALAALASGAASRTPQNSAEATYAPKLEREHGRIDWSEAAEAIERKIRAFDPWPGTFAIFRDAGGAERKVKIFSAALEPAAEAAKPGELVARGEPAILVAARGGVLRLRELQLEGKKRMSAADFVRGQPWIANASIVPAA